MSKTIGIIGSGMIGSGVARLAVAAGFNVVISNSRTPETLAGLIAELGPNARAALAAEAVAAGDIVIAAIPFIAYRNLSPELFAGKIIVDTMNYYPERDGIMTEVKTDVIASSEIVQRHLPKSYVVKALNNMDYISLVRSARPHGSVERSAVPIASDDAAARDVVSQFIEAIGYDVVDMGSLAESWRSEPTNPVYVRPYIAKSATKLTPQTAGAYFTQAARAVVSSDEVQALLAKSVRHDKMVGSMSGFTD